MNDRDRQIFYCEHMAIKRAQQTYQAITESCIQMMRSYMVNRPKPPFAVAVHSIDALVPFDELDDYM